MNYNFFKLSFLLSLQERYWSGFKLAPNGIFVLPPIFKTINLVRGLVFLVVKRNKLNKISRPVGIIFVSGIGREKSFDLSEFEFTNISQDFSEKYDYFVKKQEQIKVALEMLMHSKLLQKSYNMNIYLANLKDLFDENFWDYYHDLKYNKISKVTKEILDKRKNYLTKDSKNIKSYIKKISDKDLKNFIKTEILPSFSSNAYQKLLFLSDLGKYLEKNEDKSIILTTKKMKFEVTKIYAKIICEVPKSYMTNSSVEMVLLEMLNCIKAHDMYPRDKEIKQIFSTYSGLFTQNIYTVQNEKIRNKLNDIFKEINIDKKSPIVLAYFYLFKE